MELFKRGGPSLIDESVRALDLADSAKSTRRRKRALEAVCHARVYVKAALTAPPPRTAGNWSTARVALLDERLEAAESNPLKEIR